MSSEWQADGYVVDCGYLAETPYFAFGNGQVRFGAQGGEQIQAMQEDLLAACVSSDGRALIISGDAGHSRRCQADGSVEDMLHLQGRWIDQLIAGPRNAVGFSEGRTAYVLLEDGTLKSFPHARAVNGIAFHPKGFRLAVAHYNGATIHWVTSEGKPVSFEWKGAHLDASFSPDGAYLVTVMQENALHGWRLKDGQELRMAGYPAKVKSISWSAKGHYLATSGADAAVLWSFKGKDGPMGGQPLQKALGKTLSTVVACHPRNPEFAIGFANGEILLGRIDGDETQQIRAADGNAVSALSWQSAGSELCFGTRNGQCGVWIRA